MNAPSLRLLLIVAVLASACDNDEGPILEPDAGPDSGPQIVDEEAPQVVDTTPSDGASDVSPSAPIVIRFSEAMSQEGTLSLTADGETLSPASSWSTDGTELTLTAALPSGARIGLVLERDFTDQAGNGLAAPFALDFTTGDDIAPVVTEADPAEGATVSARTSVIRITFSEPMDPSTGTLALEGGPGELGDVSWTLGGLVVPVSGLAYDTDYRVVLSGFADPAGNALDGEAYLGDGALDFATGPDLDPPRVTDASPSEGQIEVRDTAEKVTVLFDEAMDTSVTEATLSSGGSSITVTGVWSEGGTRIDFDVFGKLARNATHSLSLAGFRDAAGNALDPVPHLADGALDFVTGVDIFAPYVGGSDPVEGSNDFSFRAPSIVVVFSEAMDTSMTSVEVSDGTSTFTANGTWSLAGTRLTLDVAGKLYASRTYHIDFSQFRDAGGTLLDTEHAYLGDGVLDFTLAPPTGENCRDALTVAEATSNSGGVVEWVLAQGVATDVDGSETCRPSGTPRVDAVIRYTKSTPSASDGGTVLHVYVDGPGTGFGSTYVSVLQNECDPNVVGTGPDRLRCVGNRNPQHLYFDVGPGDYYVWFSPNSTYTGYPEFMETTVQIEEIAAPPEGESCVAPYDTTSSIYEAPTTADDPHVWTIPAGAMHAVDHAVAYDGLGAMECDTDTGVGPDAVVELPKSSDTSIGWLEIERTSGKYAVVQLLDRCNAMDPAAESLFCEEDLTHTASTKYREMIIPGRAGSRYLWIASDYSSETEFPSTVVRYNEIEPGPGDSCATAIPIDIGTTNAVTPDRRHRLPAPSCFDRTETVTWYRFTTTERFTHVRADGDAKIASIRAADGSEMACQASAAGNTPLVVFEPTVGTDVCVGVSSGTAVTSLALEAFSYDGNLGVVTNLGIERPRSITNDYWMSVTPTTLYMGVAANGLLSVNKAGGVLADFRTDFGSYSTSTVLGNDGVAVGESIFSLDDTATASSPRVYRIVRDGAPEVSVWDTGSAYPSLGMDAITYDGTSLLYVSDSTASLATRFYSLSPSAPGPATELGLVPALENVVGIAADATYFYVVGEEAGADAATKDGVFRLLRSDLSQPPVRLATVTVDTTRASIEVDDLAAATHLYFRADNGFVHVIKDPAGTAPQHLGPIFALEDTQDFAMTIDHATGSLYVFESVTDTSGTFVRLD